MILSSIMLATSTSSESSPDGSPMELDQTQSSPALLLSAQDNAIITPASGFSLPSISEQIAIPQSRILGGDLTAVGFSFISKSCFPDLWRCRNLKKASTRPKSHHHFPTSRASLHPYRVFHLRHCRDLPGPRAVQVVLTQMPVAVRLT